MALVCKELAADVRVRSEAFNVVVKASRGVEANVVGECKKQAVTGEVDSGTEENVPIDVLKVSRQRR